jgi:hypothetical protein
MVPSMLELIFFYILQKIIKGYDSHFLCARVTVFLLAKKGGGQKPISNCPWPFSRSLDNSTTIARESGWNDSFQQYTFKSEDIGKWSTREVA